MSNVPAGGSVIEQRTRHVGSIHGCAVIECLPINLLQLLAPFPGELIGIFQLVIEVFESLLINFLVGFTSVVHSSGCNRLFLTISGRFGFWLTTPRFCFRFLSQFLLLDKAILGINLLLCRSSCRSSCRIRLLVW